VKNRVSKHKISNLNADNYIIHHFSTAWSLKNLNYIISEQACEIKQAVATNGIKRELFTFYQQSTEIVSRRHFVIPFSRF